jgi:hypothetical protein
MEDVLGLQSLRRDVAKLEADGDGDLTRLAVDLRGRDPDDAFSDVPYEKGRLFIGFLESRLGRERLDAFLRDYFQRFAFQSVDTEQFVQELKTRVLDRPDAGLTLAELRVWLDEPGIPSLAVLPSSDAFERVDEQRTAWLQGGRDAAQLDTSGWTTHHWLHFLDNLPADLSAARMAELDRAFALTASRNNAIAHSWLKDAIRARYEPAYARLEEFLTHIGRRQFVKDLYEELVASPEGRQRAQRIYAQARRLYQVPLVQQLDEIVGTPAGGSS